MRTPAETAAAFWDALYARDWEAIAGFFGPDSIYYDVPTGPGAAAKGPDDIVKRLKLGLEQLAGYDHGPATVVSEGSIVVTEHAEHWRWPTGEEVTLPFVSIMAVRDGVIGRWTDYWNMPTLMDAAPAWWHERLAGSDLAWLTDLSDQV